MIAPEEIKKINDLIPNSSISDPVTNDLAKNYINAFDLFVLLTEKATEDEKKDVSGLGGLGFRLACIRKIIIFSDTVSADLKTSVKSKYPLNYVRIL